MYAQGIKFIEGFEDFFKQVQLLNLKTGIATNADDSSLAISIKTLKLDSFFGKHIYNISYVNNVCKPSPDIYLYAAAQLGIKPEECLAIEDSAHGIEAAKRVGMFCIGLNSSKNYQQVKASDLVVDTYSQLDLASLI